MTNRFLLFACFVAFAAGAFLGSAYMRDHLLHDKPSRAAQAARDDRLWIQCQDLRTEARTDLYFASDDDHAYAGGPPIEVDRTEVRRALRKLRAYRKQCDPIERRISGMNKWREEVEPTP